MHSWVYGSVFSSFCDRDCMHMCVRVCDGTNGDLRRCDAYQHFKVHAKIRYLTEGVDSGIEGVDSGTEGVDSGTEGVH
jgi:hypothetical protein